MISTPPVTDKTEQPRIATHHGSNNAGYSPELSSCIDLGLNAPLGMGWYQKYKKVITFVQATISTAAWFFASQQLKDFPQLNRLVSMHSLTTLKQRYSIRLKPPFVYNDLRALVTTPEERTICIARFQWEKFKSKFSKTKVRLRYCFTSPTGEGYL